MKKINNRWVDENNNTWNAETETEESALKKSQSLINCSYCSDCSRCSDCSDCLGCSYCSDCSRCSDCSHCLYCSRCLGCSDCSDYKETPQRYVTPKIGSRNSNTTIYWTSRKDVQIVCGCWKGNIAEFEKRVVEVHSTTEHLQSYLKQIEIFKYLVNK